MKINAQTVDEYISKVPEDRREAVTRLRDAVRANLPEGFEERINYDMIGYVIPHSLYPQGYHCDPSQPLPFINIGNQKNHIGFYHLGLYADSELMAWFKEEYGGQCRYRLDMGKSCIRFKRMDDIPYHLIGELATKISAQDWMAQACRWRK